MSDAFVAGRLLPAQLSARTALDRNSLIRISVVLAVIVALIVARPDYILPLLTTIVALLYAASTVDRNGLLLKGLRSPALVTVSDEESLAIPDDELPIYTVLLP